MTKISKEKPEVFESIDVVGRQLSPETVALREMKVGEVLRFGEHKHGETLSGCILRFRLRQDSRLHGWSLETRHDGDDLLVKRVR